MLLLAALKPAYCTAEPEWMEMTLKVLDSAVGAAAAVAASEAAKTMFLSCILAISKMKRNLAGGGANLGDSCNQEE